MYRFTRQDGITRVRYEFQSAAEGDEFMVEAWNKVVKPNDHVYHLGDVAIRRADLQIVKRLNGHKRLVFGNHDIFDHKTYAEVGFKKMMGMRKFSNLLLTHCPVHPESIPRWCIANVHGHWHEKPSPPGRYINISVERTGYRPIALEEVKEQTLRI
jgi:calcineurin-like phosphoesterase family protein